MEKGKKWMIKKELKKMYVKVGVPIAILVTLALAACGPNPTSSPEVSPPEENGGQSPVVLCSTPDKNHPAAVSMFTFYKEVDGTVGFESQRLSGTSNTKPASDGGLGPIQGMVRTGLGGVHIPYAKVSDASGKEQILFLDLGGCLVNYSDLKKLKDFFNAVRPDQLKPGTQTSFNGRRFPARSFSRSGRRRT